MEKTYPWDIKTRFEAVRERIYFSARKVKRDPNSIKLVVVTKTHPIERIAAAVEEGIRELGENYAEEAVEKIKALGPVNNLHWHMIGHIQSRKADLVANYFDYIHSVDSLKLAQRLSRFAQENHRVLPILLECNVSGEESKYGYPAFEKEKWVNLLPEIEQISKLENLQIQGLMTMPPLYDDAEKTRPFFILLRELRDYLSIKFPVLSWNELSMGTSADFQAAIEEDATIIRVGTAIMGLRPPREK